MIEETEARGPVMNLLLEARVDLQAKWLRDGNGIREGCTPRLGKRLAAGAPLRLWPRSGTVPGEYHQAGAARCR